MNCTHCENCKWVRLNSHPMQGTHLECMHSPPDSDGIRPVVGGRDYCSYGEPNVEEEKVFIPGVGLPGVRVLPSSPERDYKSLFYQMRQGLIKLQGELDDQLVCIDYIKEALEDILRNGDRTLEEYLHENPGHARELARLDKCMKEKKSCVIHSRTCISSSARRLCY